MDDLKFLICLSVSKKVSHHSMDNERYDVNSSLGYHHYLHQNQKIPIANCASAKRDRRRHDIFSRTIFYLRWLIRLKNRESLQNFAYVRTPSEKRAQKFSSEKARAMPSMVVQGLFTRGQHVVSGSEKNIIRVRLMPCWKQLLVSRFHSLIEAKNLKKNRIFIIPFDYWCKFLNYAQDGVDLVLKTKPLRRK